MTKNVGLLNENLNENFYNSDKNYNMKILFFLMFFLMAASTFSLSDVEYCKHKLGCTNWKHSFNKCRKICTSDASPKQGI